MIHEGKSKNRDANKYDSWMVFPSHVRNGPISRRHRFFALRHGELEPQRRPQGCWEPTKIPTHLDNWKWGNALRSFIQIGKTMVNHQQIDMAEACGDMVVKRRKMMRKMGNGMENQWILRVPNVRSKANVAKIIISDPKAAVTLVPTCHLILQCLM